MGLTTAFETRQFFFQSGTLSGWAVSILRRVSAILAFRAPAGSGWQATAVSPSMVSGRVVATTT